MKRILLTLALTILLAPALMGATPTPTPEPTKVTMPEGWTAIAETREIGGRQVVLNEKGDAATQIDGEWYPVDARGCFYKEFFDPEIQKKDPRIMELVEKINSESSASFGSDNIGENSLWPRHAGGTIDGYIVHGKRPYYGETIVDGIIADQQLCFNEKSGEWEHVLNYVLARSEKAAPKDTMVMRGVVGWLRDGKYVSFTHRQEGKQTDGFPDISGRNSRKANTLVEASELWQELIINRDQVSVRLPYKFKNADGTDFKNSFVESMKQLPQAQPWIWGSDLQDSVFVEWAFETNNQLQFFGNQNNDNNFYLKHAAESWRYWGEQAAAGKMPEPVIRTITEAEH